jgi:hypothetical protein
MQLLVAMVMALVAMAIHPHMPLCRMFCILRAVLVMTLLKKLAYLSTNISCHSRDMQ